jgi:WD40 repeat protein
VYTLAFSPNGSRLASGSYDHTVRLWDPATGQCLQTLEGHSSGVRTLASSPDGSRLASGSEDHTVRLWDLATAQSLQTLEGHRGWMNTLAFSLDGSRLASGSDDRTVRLWNPATGKCLQTLEGHSGWVYTLAFSPDGSSLETNKGTLTLDSTILNISNKLEPLTCAICLENTWVTFNKQNLLWLPPEYRSPQCSAVYNNQLVFLDTELVRLYS